MKQAETAIETEFLKSFVLECFNQVAILNSSQIIKSEKKTENLLDKKPNIQNRQIISPEIKRFVPIPIRPEQTPTKQQNQLMPARTLRPMARTIQKTTIPQNVRPIIRPNVQPSPPLSVPKIDGMEKINPLLSDPSIMGIECPGPDRPVLVNKSGRIQATSTVMTAEEINKLMDEISKITKIPVIPGVFKAAFGMYLITAVVSEFVGTRFIIQKKSPFMQMQ